MMGCYLSVIPRRITITHRVLRIRSWRVGIQRAWMNSKLLLLMPSTWCMFALDLRGRFRLASIRSFSLTIRCIRVSRRVPNIHRILIMLEYFIDIVAPFGLDKNTELFHRFLSNSDLSVDANQILYEKLMSKYLLSITFSKVLSQECVVNSFRCRTT